MASPASRHYRNVYRPGGGTNIGKKQPWRKAPSPVRHKARKAHTSPRRTGARSVNDRIPSARTEGQETRLSTYTTHRRNAKQEAPTSIEAEHRLILSTATQTQNDLKSFKAAYKTENIDFAKCITTAREVLSQMEKDEREIEFGSDFFYLLDSKLIDPQLKHTKEFEHLELLCEKSKRFGSLIPRVKNKLSECVKNHLAKYCLSFIEEADGIYIKLVSEYEDKIIDMKKSLEKNLQECKDSYDEYLKQSTPFINGFLEGAENLQSRMDSIITVAINACETMKQWVKADKIYPAKLWDYIINSNTNRSKAVDAQKKLARKRDDQAHVIHRKELACDKVYQQLSDTKLEKKKHKTHIENLADRTEQTEKELENKKQQLELVTHEIENRKSNSPKYFERLWDKKLLLEQQIFKVEERLEMLDRQEVRYNKMNQDFDKSIEELQEEVDAQTAHIDNLRHKLRQYESELTRNAHALKMKQDSTATAKKIREMKLSPQTLRKIYFQKLDSTSKDLLQEACKNVAIDIGRDWENLYLDLKFFPTRSKDKRHKDLEAIKLHSVQREKTVKMLAFLSLQKWRIFNRNASIEELVKSLRRIEKFALAHRLEHRFMKSATAKT